MEKEKEQSQSPWIIALILALIIIAILFVLTDKPMVQEPGTDVIINRTKDS